jgi:hypothetical protein
VAFTRVLLIHHSWIQTMYLRFFKDTSCPFSPFIFPSNLICDFYVCIIVFPLKILIGIV